MKFVVDENVSYGLVEVLRKTGHNVTAIGETPTGGMDDLQVFNIVVGNEAVLITRDYHFTNAVRFPHNRTAGIIFIRRGNLTSEEEIGLVRDFLSHHSPEDYAGRLVTLYKNSVKIR
ncbi:MAG: DUF5615 family PIN-like protein [Nitrospirae bacterium]|nr:DUF5615 family PIN-like protein [Nitrospirota bacterium]